KFMEGGWFPLTLGLLLFLMMSTWQSGRANLMASIRSDGVGMDSFVKSLQVDEIQRADRVAVYMVADPDTVPQALLHNLKHNQVLHDRNVILTVRFSDAARVPVDERLQIEDLGKGFWK